MELTADDGSTDAVIFNAHGSGANAISWAPSVLAAPAGGAKPAPGGQQVVAQKRFASGGSDNVIRIWSFDETAKKWVEEEQINGHDNWVRDVAWAPNIGLPGQYIASASQVSTFQNLADFRTALSSSTPAHHQTPRGSPHHSGQRLQNRTTHTSPMRSGACPGQSQATFLPYPAAMARSAYGRRVSERAGSVLATLRARCSGHYDA